MDAQDRQDGNLSNGLLTRKIFGCSFDVINELGTGFLESVYENAMIIALIDAGLAVESQKSIHVEFRFTIVGEFFADFLVEETMLVELKAVKALLPGVIKSAGIYPSNPRVRRHSQSFRASIRRTAGGRPSRFFASNSHSSRNHSPMPDAPPSQHQQLNKSQDPSQSLFPFP